MSAAETLTIVSAPALWMAKRVSPGRTESYSRAKHLDVATVPIADLDALAGVLARLVQDPHAAIIRGALIDPSRTRGVRRLLYTDRKNGEAPTFREQPRQWLALDIERVERPPEVAATDLAGCAAVAIATLPAAFRGARCIVQASASHGIRPDIRLRLWYWLSRPTAGEEAKRWLAGTPADPAVFGAVQPIYTAAPLFLDGAVDPIPERLVELPGAPCVTVPAPESLAPPPKPSRPTRPVGEPSAPSEPREPVSDATIEAFIERCLARVRNAGEGQKHRAVRAAAVALGGIQDQAKFTDAEATRWLLNALPDTVEDWRQAEETIAWGLANGRGRPIELRQRQKRKTFCGDSGAPVSHLQNADKETLPNGAYLRPEDTSLPPFHPWITESREEGEGRLRHSIQSFFATAEPVLLARKERQRRRDAAIEEAMEEAKDEDRELTPADKAAITRRVTAEVAAAYGFPGKTMPKPVHQLETGSQGNGKTRLSLAGVAAISGDLTVRKYAPTLERAEEDLREYRSIATEGSMPGLVVRGRTALDPLAAPGVTMCRRPAVADRAAKLGISPRLTICKGCEFFGKCGTIRQEKTIAALGTRAVFFVNREYAHLPCPAPDPDIIIGDEQMTLPAVGITSIEPAKLVGELVPYRGHDLADVMAARTTLERLRAPLMAAHPLDAIREEEGINKKQLQSLRNLLENEAEPFLHGSMPDAKIDAELDKIDHPDRRHALTIVAAVLREIEAPRATLNAVRYNKRRDLIRASSLRVFVDGIKNTAVLLLDGTGDLELNEKLTRSKLDHNIVRMERDAEVYGTIGKRYSRQSVIGKNAKGEDLRPEAAKRLRDEIGIIASHFDTPLLTATKQAEEALVEGGHLPADVMTSHGGMTRSINKWETNRQTAIDVAPDVATIEDLELIAGAFYARDPEPIVSMAAQADDLPADWPYKPWPYRASRLRRFADGKLQVVHVDVHPDPRVDRIFQQITDANIIQNLDRVRPIYNHRDLVAMNERALDLTYTRVSRHREMVEGGPRIDRILKKTDGVLPMTPATLSALFPAEAGSISTARRAVRAWRKWGHGVNGTSIYPLTPFSYRIAGQPGRPSVVLVSPHHEDPKAAAEAVLGSVVAFQPIVVQPPPQHPQAPPADAPAAPEAVRNGGLRPPSHTGWVPPMPRQPGSGAAPPSVMVHGPPDG